MGRIIFEFLTPILLIIYGVVDILIPSFTTLEYFWFLKSFRSKAKASFKNEVYDAKKSYLEAIEKWNKLKDSATHEAEEAKEKLAKAEKVYEEAVSKTKRPTNNKKQTNNGTTK